VTARDRTILLVLGAVVALAAFWFLAIKPKHAEAQSLAEQVTKQQTRLQSAQTTLAAGVSAKANFAVNAATIAEVGKAIPADEDVPSLLYQLQSVSHNARVTFDSIERATASPGASTTTTATGATGTAATAALPPGTVVGTAGLVTAPFMLKFTGSYFDLRRFVGDVQAFVRAKGDNVTVSGRLLTIDGVSLTTGEKGRGGLEAQIVATAYLAPTTTSAGAGSTTPPTGTATPDSGTAAAPASTSNAIPGGTN
jgi:Tfp pilus assembly protein PilO